MRQVRAILFFSRSALYFRHTLCLEDFSRLGVSEIAFNAGDIEAKLILDRSQFNKELREAQAEVERFEKEKHKVKIGVELDDKKFRADLKKLKEELAKTKDFKIKATLDADGIRREVDALAKSLRGKFTLNADLDDAAARAKAAAIKGGKVQFSADFDGASAKSKAEALAKSMKQTVKFDTDIDTKKLLAQIEELTKNKKVKIDFELDGAAKAAAEIAAIEKGLQGAATGAGSAGEGMSTFATYAAIAAAATPPIAAALISLPAILSTAVVGISGVALGMDGIKQSASNLNGVLGTMKDTVSNVFVNGLRPAIEGLTTALPRMTTGFINTSAAVAQMGVQLTNVVTSAQGMKDMQVIFTGVQQTISQLTPAFVTFAENVRTLAAQGLPAFKEFGPMLQEVGVQFGNVIEQMSKAGTIQGAISGLIDVLGGLLSVIPPLVQAGAQFMTTFGPPLAAALHAVGSVLGFLTGPLGNVTNAVLAMVAAWKLATMAATGFAAVGTRIATAFGGVGSAASKAGAGTTVFAGGVGRAGDAADKAEKGTSKFSGAMGKVGAALPIIGVALVGIGIAYDNFSSKATDAASAALAGSKTYQQAVNDERNVLEKRASLLDFNVAIEKELRNAGFDSAKMMEIEAAARNNVNTEIEKQIASMSPLEAAQARVQLAQGKLNDAMRDYGPNTRQAIDASNALAQAQQVLNQRQTELAQETMKSQMAILQQNAGLRQAQFETMTWANAMQVAASSTSSAGDITTAFAGAMGSASDASRNLGIVQVQNKQATDQYKESLKGVSAGLVDASGKIDLAKKGGMELQMSFIQAAQGADNLAGATLASTGSVVDAAAAWAAGRNNLIELGVAAGIPRANMIALADSMMKVPKELKPVIEMPGAAKAIVDAMGLGSAIVSIPDDKTVIVKSLTETAEANLKALGFTVTHLPDGTVKISSNTELFDKGVAAAKALVEKTKALMGIDGKTDLLTGTVQKAKDWIKGLFGSDPVPVDGDPKPLIEKVGDVIKNFTASKPKIPIDGDAQPVRSAADTVRSYIEGLQAKLKIDGDPATAKGAADGVKTYIDLLQGKLGINGEDRGANDKANAIKAQINGILSTMGVSSEDRGANDKANAIKAQINAILSTMGVNSEDRGAKSKADAIKAQIDALMGIEGVNAQDRGANSAATAIKNAISAMLGIEGVNAADRGAIAVARGIVAQISGMVATIRINAIAGSVASAAGSVVSAAQQASAAVARAAGQEIGGIVKMERFDQGGVWNPKTVQKALGLRPMKSGWAQVIGPRTWRVVGDRTKDDEAYIPINRSLRSISILMQTAKRMGFNLLDSKGKLSQYIQQLVAGQSGGHHGGGGSSGSSSGGYQRPAGIPEGQWGWNTSDYGKSPNTIPDHVWRKVVHELQHSGKDKWIVDAITKALQSRTFEQLNVQLPQGASVKEIVDEVSHRLRHVRRGVYR